MMRIVDVEESAVCSIGGTRFELLKAAGSREQALTTIHVLLPTASFNPSRLSCSSLVFVFCLLFAHSCHSSSYSSSLICLLITLSAALLLIECPINPLLSPHFQDLWRFFVAPVVIQEVYPFFPPLRLRRRD